MEHDTTHSDAAAHAPEAAHHEEYHPGWSTYWKVALILTVITVGEVWMYYVPAIVASRAFVPGLLALSALKFKNMLPPRRGAGPGRCCYITTSATSAP